MLLLGLVVMACQPSPPPDLLPPQLLGASVDTGGHDLSLQFSEPVEEAQAEVEDPPSPEPARIEGPTVKVPLPRTLKPGQDYRWKAEVKDAQKNLTSVAGRFYGPNSHPAGLRLNEVRVAGSGTKTDLIELRVEADGSLGGWTLEVWSGPEAKQRLVFPDVEVTAGQFVVVDCRAAPKNSTQKSADSSAAYVLPASKGLSATKGFLALRQSPTGPITDGLLYSKVAGQGVPIAQAAGWNGTDELDPSGCTATRTWSRTDEVPAKWLLVANGCATPGSANKLTPWAGPPSIPVDSATTKG